MNKLKKTLALLLSLVMILSLLPAAAFAVDELPAEQPDEVEEISELVEEEAHADVAPGSVAKIGDAGYPTLAAALAAAQANDTVTLLENVSGSFSINKSLTLTAEGNAKITGSGTTALLINASDVEVTLDGITVATGASRGVGIDTDCSGVTLNINNCTIGAGYYALDTRPGADSARITITGSTINGYCAMNIWGNNGTITASNTSLTGYNDVPTSSSNDFGVIVLEADTSVRGITEPLYQKYADGNVITLTNCTIGASTNANSQAVVVFNAYGEDKAKGAHSGYLNAGYHAQNNTVTFDACTYVTTTIGGLVYDGASVLAGNEASAINSSYGNEFIVMTSGSYTSDPTAYLAEGYEAIGNNGTWTVQAKKTYVAQIGDEKYETLAEAVAAAVDGDIITLIDNFSIDSSTKIEKSVTIDGNGKTLTVTGGNGGYALDINDNDIKSSVDVTIKNLTLNTTGYQVAVMLIGDYSSKVSLKNVRITTDGACVYANGHAQLDAEGCTFVRNGEYTSPKDAVYYSALLVGYGADMSVADCTVTSDHNGAATFPSGGAITLTDTDITITGSGYAIWSRNEDYTNYPDYLKDSIINFQSGNVVGEFKITDSYTGDDPKNKYDAVISITGGKFTADPTTYVAAGYEAIDNKDGTWTVQKHEHTPDYEHPTVYWANINGEMTAIFYYSCAADGTRMKSERVEPVETVSTGVVTYTATDSHNNERTKEQQEYYAVTVDGVQNGGSYKWGEVCTITKDSTKAWYIVSGSDEYKVADGKSSYSFPVTGNVELVTGDSSVGAEDTAAVVLATLTSDKANTATFQAKWSLPDGATVTSVQIYRGYTSTEKTIGAATLKAAGSASSVNLLVRNGDYKLNLTGLTSGKYQHVVIEIQYKLDGSEETQTLTSSVKRAQVK